jgi:hypothetical protein
LAVPGKVARAIQDDFAGHAPTWTLAYSTSLSTPGLSLANRPVTEFGGLGFSTEPNYDVTLGLEIQIAGQDHTDIHILPVDQQLDCPACRPGRQSCTASATQSAGAAA